MDTEEANFVESGGIKVVLGGMVGLLVGCAIGASYLITLPVKEVSELPDTIDPQVRYVLKGRTAGGDSWKFKASELQGGKEEVTFLETELNRWANSFSTNFPEEKPGFYIEPKKPLFRLEGETLLVSARAESALGAWQKTLTLSLEGDFIPGGDSLQIDPKKLYLGSLRIPSPVKEFVWKEISSSYVVDDELQSLWYSIESAAISESQLILTAKK